MSRISCALDGTRYQTNKIGKRVRQADDNLKENFYFKKLVLKDEKSFLS